MGRRGYVPLRCFGDVPLRHGRMFHLRFVLRRRGDIPMGRRHNVPLRSRQDIPTKRLEDEPLRRFSDVSLIRRRVFRFRRTCDVAGTYGETLLRCRRNVLLPSG